MCGIIGVTSSGYHFNAVQEVLNGLKLLQHRGQDAYGLICGSADGKVACRRETGLVSEIFMNHQAAGLHVQGRFGIGHGEEFFACPLDTHD
jgi:amidophosphoribosyltransferase